MVTDERLCVMPSCRIRGRHLPDCADDEECVGCLPRIAEEGRVCDRCLGWRRRDLEDIADTIGAARDVAHGLSTPLADVGASGVPESTVPFDLTATAKLDGVLVALTARVDEIGPLRGVSRPWFGQHGDPVAAAAVWLGPHLEWVRHRENAAEILRDITAAARIVRGIVRGPAASRYLGPCGATVTWDEDGNETDRDEPCTGDVYARRDAADGACRSCKARWPVDARQAWIDEQTAELAAPARDIAYALDLSVKTIRSWAAERRSDSGTLLRAARLRTYYRAGAHVVPWTDRPDGVTDEAWKTVTEKRGPRLHYVGDVRQLAERAADRRAAAEQRRDGAAV